MADAALDASQEAPPADGNVDSKTDAGVEPELDAGPVKPDASVDQPTTSLTYHTDMLPLFETHCLPCHDAGGAGPFSIRHYPSVYAYRFSIRGATRVREMPPCDTIAAAECGLTDDEIARIADWVVGGAPEGQAE